MQQASGTPIQERGGASVALEAGWTWPPYATYEDFGGQRFLTEEWAPASTVLHPRLRVGRWTLLYRRGA